MLITGTAHLGLEPINEMNNVRMVQLLQQVQFIIDHAFVAPNIALQDNFDCNFARRAVCLADNTICSCTQSPPEPIQGPAGTERLLFRTPIRIGKSVLLLVTFGLPRELIEHICDYYTKTVG